MEIKEIIKFLETFVENPSSGLPEEIFLFISRITPLVNVDLLIKNDKNQTLLTWREDGYYGPGWHIPGGIIRYKESFRKRIGTVAQKELGARVNFEKEPMAVNEVVCSRKNRGHFISLLYKCVLKSPLDEKIHYKEGEPKKGEWAWHSKCPGNIISVHKIYKDLI